MMRIKHSRLALFRLILLLLALLGAVKAQEDVYHAFADGLYERPTSEFTSTSTAAASIALYGTFHAMGVIVTIAAADDPGGNATAAIVYRTGGESYQAGFPLSRVDDTRFGERQVKKQALNCVCLFRLIGVY